MSTSPAFTELDWAAAFDAAASLDYTHDRERHPWPARDTRTPCSNVNCDQLTEALYCREACREEVEGPDHEPCDEETDRIGRSAVATPAPLPGAPCSVNVRVSIHGYDCQVTLRDHHEATLLHRLETLLQRYPVEAAPAQVSPSTPTCPIHQVPMKEQHGNYGLKWYSHKAAEGWCKGREKGRRHGERAALPA
jgi:hypothetical protein